MNAMRYGGQGRFCRCNYVKDFDIWRLFWIIQMDPKCNHKCPNKKEPQRDLRYKRKQSDFRGTDWTE